MEVARKDQVQGVGGKETQKVWPVDQEDLIGLGIKRGLVQKLPIIVFHILFGQAPSLTSGILETVKD